MKLANMAWATCMVVLGTTAVGCTADANGDDEDGRLGTNESLLVEDNDAVEENDQDAEAGLEDPLSGADPTNPGTPAEGTTLEELMDKVRGNPGKWFKPAGCITTTVEGNVAKHAFKGCKGPWGLAEFEGSVTSTYVREGGVLTITHEASGFSLNGASVSGKRVIVYSKSGNVVTKHRTGTWSGTTKNGKEFSHDADFTATWDPVARCVTRDGSASTQVGGRELTRSIAGYKRCGIGNLGCPESGTITLTRTKGDREATVTLQFTGGRNYVLKRRSGREVTGVLVCRDGT